MKRTRPPFLLFQSVRERIPGALSRPVRSARLLVDPPARLLVGSVLSGFWSILQLAFWSVCPARLWADPSPRQPGRAVRLLGVPALSYAGGRIVRAGHAVPKWSFRPESAVVVGPDDERGGRLNRRPPLLVGCCANQKATVSPLIVTLPKTAVALSLLLPLLTATPRQKVSGSPPSKLSVRTLPKVAPPSSE